MDAHNNRRLIKIEGVCEIVTMKKSTVHKWRKNPLFCFPKELHQGARSVRWWLDEIMAWNELKLAGVYPVKSLNDIPEETAKTGSNQVITNQLDVDVVRPQPAPSVVSIESLEDLTTDGDALTPVDTLRLKRLETVRNILIEHAKLGTLVWREYLMGRTMLSFEDPYDHRVMNKIIEELTKETHDKHKVLLGLMVVEEIAGHLPNLEYLNFVKNLGYPIKEAATFVNEHRLRLKNHYLRAEAPDVGVKRSFKVEVRKRRSFVKRDEPPAETG